MIGGILTDPATSFGGPFDTQWWSDHPYFLPCLFAALLSLSSMILAIWLLPESLSPEAREKEKRDLKNFWKQLSNLSSITRMPPSIRKLVYTNSVFLLAFTMMHATFILYTAMPIADGGRRYDERTNGYIFAYVGLVGVIGQGGLIRKLSEKFEVASLMLVGIALTALGLGSIPYPSPTPLIILLVMTLIAAGNGLFQPSQSTLLTHESRVHGLDLGGVMGVQEGFGALSRIIGPVLAALIWSETVDGIGLWTYHTVFRVAGLVAIFALGLNYLPNSKIEKEGRHHD